jgi:hypothetical protein
MRQSYHAADAVAVDAQKLSAIAPDALMAARLKIAPATQVIISDYPIYAIYRANTVADAPKPVMQAESVLVTRPGFDPQIHLINRAGAACVAALIKGQSLGQTLAGADESLDLGAVLGVLLAQGAIVEIN